MTTNEDCVIEKSDSSERQVAATVASNARGEKLYSKSNQQLSKGTMQAFTMLYPNSRVFVL